MHGWKPVRKTLTKNIRLLEIKAKVNFIKEKDSDGSTSKTDVLEVSVGLSSSTKHDHSVTFSAGLSSKSGNNTGNAGLSISDKSSTTRSSTASGYIRIGVNQVTGTGITRIDETSRTSNLRRGATVIVGSNKYVIHVQINKP